MDIQTLASLVVIRTGACFRQSDLDLPWLCPDGVAEGTLVEHFWIGVCGGGYGHASAVEQYVAALFDPTHQGYLPPTPRLAIPLRVYAVTREMDGAYWAYFVYEPNSSVRSLFIDQTGAISSIGYGCGGDSASVAVRGDRPFLLRPPASASPPAGTAVPPAPPRTGNLGAIDSGTVPAGWMLALAVLVSLAARLATRGAR
jgi:hypothetical protein